MVTSRGERLRFGDDPLTIKKPAAPEFHSFGRHPEARACEAREPRRIGGSGRTVALRGSGSPTTSGWRRKDRRQRATKYLFLLMFYLLSKALTPAGGCP